MITYMRSYVDFQGASAAPKKTVRMTETTSSVSAGGLDGLPREDISGKITPALLKGLESPDWKVWSLSYIKLANLFVIFGFILLVIDASIFLSIRRILNVVIFPLCRFDWSQLKP